MSEIISLGGVGGCELAFALRSLNMPAYPYDWIVSAQSFILLSFENKVEFFAFDDGCVHVKTHLISPRKNAVMPHDFTNFDIQSQEVIDKYQRRYDRLEAALRSDKSKPILFVRIMDNLTQDLVPLHFYDDIFIREEEDLGKWNTFIENVSAKYKVSCKLLLITDNLAHTSYPAYPNLILKHVTDKTRKTIAETCKSCIITLYQL